MKKFRHLNVPSHWQQYWSKYPQGYTILEALLGWVDDVNKLVDNANNTNELVNRLENNLTDFTNKFDDNLEDEVSKTLQDWLDSGFINVVIDEVLYTQMNELRDEVTGAVKEVRDYSTKNYKNVGTVGSPKRPIVSFIADDGPKNDLTKLLPSIRRKSIPFGIGVITDHVGTSNFQNIPLMTWDELHMLEDEGCEIMGHTATHTNNSTTMTRAALDADIKRCKATLVENGFNSDGFIYPYNAYNQATQSVVSQYFKYSFARVNDRGTQENFPYIDNNAICRVGLGSFPDVPSPEFENQDTMSYEYYMERVDHAIENDDWLVFVIHTHTTNHPAEQQQHLENIVDYIRSRGVDIVLPSEGFRRFGNMLQATETNGDRTYIDSNGVAGGPYLGTKVEGINQSTSASLISDFDLNKITYTPINTTEAKAGNYPNSNAGILTTYKLTDGVAHIRQVYEPTLIYGAEGRVDNLKFTRYWYNNEWTDWTASTIKGLYNVTMVGLVAGQTYDTNIFIGELGINNDYVINMHTTADLPEGLIYQTIRISSNSIRIRFSNIGSSSTSPGTIQMLLTAVKGG